MDLILYTNPMSRGRMARWMLEETGASYETHLLEYGTTMKGAEYLAINPMGKVPAIKHGETVVTETAAICAYLADAFPDAKLAPAPADRGRYYRWLFFAAGCLEPAMANKAAGVDPASDKKQTYGYGDFADTMNGLEFALTGTEFIAGDVFSAADVYVGSCVGFGLQFGTVEKRPAFEEYWARLQQRPACLRAKELDDADMPAQ